LYRVIFLTLEDLLRPLGLSTSRFVVASIVPRKDRLSDELSSSSFARKYGG
jgi:sulfur carrier protein ThiS